MNKCFFSVLSAILFAGFSTSQAQSDYASCITDGPATCLSAGGVVAVITVYTNSATGKSKVLPVRVKMFDDVLGNPLWYVITNGVFGSNVTVLPTQDVSAPQGYMQDWPGHPAPPGYSSTYSSSYPIIIESSTSGSWSNEFYFCLYGGSTASAGCGPAPHDSSSSKGIIEAKLYDGSNTNGLDNSVAVTTNSIMGRFGLGACDTRYVTVDSRSSVAFIYFNLPPKPTTDDPVLSQPWANILSEPFLEGWCGFSTNTINSGFHMCWPNANNIQNWPHYPAPCDSNPLKQFRVRFDGNQCCDSQACASTPSLIYGVSAGKMNLSFQLQPGFSYEIVYKNDLRDTNWLTLLPWIGGTGTIILRDPMTSPKRFYRLNYTTE